MTEPIFDSDLIRQIEAIELGELRALREALLAPQDEVVLQRLRDVDSQICAVRAVLKERRAQRAADVDGKRRKE